jgi:RNA recognition motif-containing protein
MPCHALPQRCEIKKTYAFVEFESLEDAKEACQELHGAKINGREITGGWRGHSGRRRAGGAG